MTAALNRENSLASRLHDCSTQRDALQLRVAELTEALTTASKALTALQKVIAHHEQVAGEQNKAITGLTNVVESLEKRQDKLIDHILFHQDQQTKLYVQPAAGRPAAPVRQATLHEEIEQAIAPDVTPFDAESDAKQLQDQMVSASDLEKELDEVLDAAQRARTEAKSKRAERIARTAELMTQPRGVLNTIPSREDWQREHTPALD